MPAYEKLHLPLSVVIGLAVPAAVYFVNGSAPFAAFVLGAVVGFCYWYFGPDFPIWW